MPVADLTTRLRNVSRWLPVVQNTVVEGSSSARLGFGNEELQTDALISQHLGSIQRG
jgi:hypothetical protein